MGLGASDRGLASVGNLAEIGQLEERRLQEQRRLDAEKTSAQRNASGQFATPPGLALDIARFLKALWENRQDRLRFLEPCVGTGSFYSALQQTFHPSDWASAQGFETDARLAQAANDIWGRVGLKVIHADFTAVEPPQSEGDLPNLIVTNPPYVRHHHLSSAAKARLKVAVTGRLGVDTNGLSGLYCYILLLADSWLSSDGISVWLVPTEFMEVNYGAALRTYLSERVSLVHLHMFDRNDVQFDDALVSSAIVVFKKKTPATDHMVTLSFGRRLTEPLVTRQVPISTLKKSRKWTRLMLQEDDTQPSSDTLTLASLFDIKRGIATGANAFFISTRTEAASRGIPDEFLRPILPSPRHLNETVIESDLEGHPCIDEQLVVIDCDLPEPIIRHKYPDLWGYLEQGKALGVPDRYLTSKRKPWYRQEQRDPAPYLCTYMGRSGKNGKPFRFIWNKSRALATNVYLLLYPKGVLAQALVDNPDLYPVIFRLLNEIDVSDLVGEGRMYGGGLHKLEPFELGRVPAPQFSEAIRNTSGPVVYQSRLWA